MSASHPLNIIFAGTPEFAAVALRSLLDSPHAIKAVYTQPDRPAGRGQQLHVSPVKKLALQYDLPLYQPVSLRDQAVQQSFADLQADVLVVAAYGLILPLAILKAPRLGSINIHASLLPRWRGAAPIQRAILAGDQETGITIMQMEEGLDTGPMLYQVTTPILPSDTSAILQDRLAILGASALLTTLDQLSAGKIEPESQAESLVTYAHKMTKEEARLNWQSTAVMLDRQVRAFNPWPVAFTNINEKILRVWQAEVINHDFINQQPGKIVKVSPEGIDVAAKLGILRLKKVQLPGGRVLSVADLLNARQEDFAVNKMLGEA